jgi:hypothetical protein
MGCRITRARGLSEKSAGEAVVLGEDKVDVMKAA